jgi:hypothetical protein
MSEFKEAAPNQQSLTLYKVHATIAPNFSLPGWKGHMLLGSKCRRLNRIFTFSLEEDRGEGSAASALGSGQQHRMEMCQALSGVLALEEAWPWQRQRS